MRDEAQIDSDPKQQQGQNPSIPHASTGLHIDRHGNANNSTSSHMHGHGMTGASYGVGVQHMNPYAAVPNTDPLQITGYHASIISREIFQLLSGAEPLDRDGIINAVSRNCGVPIEMASVVFDRQAQVQPNLFQALLLRAKLRSQINRYNSFVQHHADSFADPTFIDWNTLGKTSI